MIHWTLSPDTMVEHTVYWPVAFNSICFPWAITYATSAHGCSLAYETITKVDIHKTTVISARVFAIGY